MQTMDNAASALSATSPTRRRNRGAGHWWRNFRACWPLVLGMIVGVLGTLVPSVLSPDRWGARVGYAFFRAWSRGLLWGFGVRVHVRGLEHIRPGRTCILVANHRSHLDVPCLGVTLPLHLVTVHKKELEYIPFLGQALWMSRSVGLHRSDKVGSRRRLAIVAARLKAGMSVAIFAEGRRSTGPRLDPFKKGAVVLAIEQQCDVIPVTVTGTDVLYPPGAIMVNEGDVLVEVHAPISANGRAAADRDALNREIFEAISRSFVPGPVSGERLRGATRIV